MADTDLSKACDVTRNPRIVIITIIIIIIIIIIVIYH